MQAVQPNCKKLHSASPKIRHRAARHQWSVSNAWACCQSWDCSFRGRQGDLLHRSRDFKICCVTFLQSCFSMIFLLPLVAILAPNSLPKWTQNPTKIDEQIVSVAISKKVPKNVTKFNDFLLFLKRPMCLKHSKYCIRTTFSLLVNDPENYAKTFKK